MKKIGSLLILCALALLVSGCAIGGDVVRVTDVTAKADKGLGQKELARLAEIKGTEQKGKNGSGLSQVIKETPNYTLTEYLRLHPEAINPAAMDYKVGGYDTLDIMVYEEADLSRQGVRVSPDGQITFPLIGRVQVGDLTASEIERRVANKLAQGQFLNNAHVSVTVSGYNSRKFMVLGPVNQPGTYPLKAQERVLDAISKAGGIDFQQGGNELMIVRTLSPDRAAEKKVVIRISLPALLNEGDQASNLLLLDKDLLYFPKVKHFYILGQVQKPGSFPYHGKNISLVEAISMAGGFTELASRNRTRIVRLEGEKELLIEVKVDAIPRAGKKGQDVTIAPGDVIIVPESFF